jgi:hypothetical protein
MREAAHDGCGDDRRIGAITPDLLERRIAGAEVQAFDDEMFHFHFTTCSGSAPAAARAVRMFRRTCSVLGA